MAAWGQGDPRWIVEHRDDGKNVNGWHWEEKNKVEWSRQRVAELLCGLQTELDGQGGYVRLTKLKDLTGEALLTTRKGNKKCAVYDLVITLQWEGHLTDGKDKVKGEVKIEEFASTADPEDFVFTVTAEGTGQPQNDCRRIVEGMRGTIVERLQQYAIELAEQ